MRPVGWKHPRSGYYAWRDRPLSATARRRQDLTIIIARFFADSDQTYGYRRIRAELARHGIQASAQTVRKIMAANDMTPCQPRKKTRTTVQAADLPGRPDRLHRNFTANAPAVTWVGDITYGRHETKPYFSWISCAVSDMIGTCRLRSPGKKPPS